MKLCRSCCTTDCGKACVFVHRCTTTGADVLGVTVTLRTATDVLVGTGVTVSRVKTIAVTLAGTGYSAAPGVTIGGGGGSGATATTRLATTGVGSVTLTGGGSNYINAPAVFPSTGSAGFITALAPGPIVALTMISGGFGYPPGTGYALVFNNTNTGGTGAAGTFDVDESTRVVNVQLTSGGSNYVRTPNVSLPGSTEDDPANVRAEMSPQPVASISIVTGGNFYSIAPGVVINPPTGPGGGATATATATLATRGIIAIDVVEGGSGFTSAPTVAVDPPPGGGTTATGTATIGAGACIPISVGAFNYKVTVSKAGWATRSVVNLTFQCGTPSTNQDVFIQPETGPSTFTVRGCNGLPFPGATVTVKDSVTGATVDGGTTDGSGVFTFAAGRFDTVYNVDVDGGPRFIPQANVRIPPFGTGINTCTQQNYIFALAVGTDYLCFFSDCLYPVSKTLTISVPGFGTRVCPYGNFTTNFGTFTGWRNESGAGLIDIPGCGGENNCLGHDDVNTLWAIRATGLGGVVFEFYYSGDSVQCCPITDQANCGVSGGLASKTCPPSTLMSFPVIAATNPKKIICSDITVTAFE